MPVKIKQASRFTGHSGAVYALCPGFEDNILFSGSSDKKLAAWDLASFSPINFSASLPSIIYTIAIQSEKQLIFTGTSTGGIHIINKKERQEIKFIQLNSPVFNISILSEREIFLALCGNGELYFFNLNDFSLLKKESLTSAKLRDSAINEKLNLVAVAGGDGFIYIYNLFTLELINKFEAHTQSVNAVCWHPSENYLLSGGKDAHLNIWDFNGGIKLIKSIPAHNFAIYSIAFSPDKKWIATASRDKTVKIWESDTFEIIERLDKAHFNGHLNSVNKLIWLKYNNLLISTGDDRSIICWEIRE